jgi:RNA polymerase sigma-70 factor (ECF subfamily)
VLADDAGDAELVDAAQGGDRDALEQLLRRHHDRVRALARRLCGNDADAADATQEALLAIVRGLDRFDGRAAFTTWLHRVATNACLDELRRRARRPQPAPDGIVGRAVSPGDTADVVTARVDVDAALATLPLDFRAAVVLRDLCALDYAEIGEVLGIPAGTVRSRIARGRAQIAAFLGNPDGDDERPRTSP